MHEAWNRKGSDVTSELGRQLKYNTHSLILNTDGPVKTESIRSKNKREFPTMGLLL